MTQDRIGRTPLLVAAASLLALVSVAAQNEPVVITLRNAVDEALARHPSVVNQQDARTEAELALRLARDAFRPRLLPNIQGSLGQSDLASQSYRIDLTERLTTGTELRVGVGTATSQIPAASGAGDVNFYSADTTVSISQPLLRGFGRAVATRQVSSATLRLEDADRQTVETRQQLAIEVATAYYRVVAQESFLSVARQSLDRARALRGASEAKLGAGLVSQLDVLRAQQFVLEAEMQLFDAQGAGEDARDQLLFLMGRPSSEAIQVVRQIPLPDGAPIDIDGAVRIALANRLDIQRQRRQSTDTDLQLRYARNQLLPQVDVNLSLTRRQTSDTFAGSFGLDGYRFATFFTISMPVDRTAQQVAYQNAVLTRARQERELTTLERRVEDDVRRALRDRDRLVRNVAASGSGVDIARREVEVAQLRYERGLSNNLDVVTAESGLLAAESRRIQALAEAAIGRLRLRAVLGVLDPAADMETPPAVQSGGQEVP